VFGTAGFKSRRQRAIVSSRCLLLVRVMRTRFPPAVSETQMSPSQSYAMRTPSGDQSGSSQSGLEGLIFLAFAPVVSITQIA